jgi:ABC-2 type transport system ATP-binding protein
MNIDTPVIAVDHLVRKFGRHDAVNGLSLRVERGQCYGFFGRSGAGKTTTIKCVLSLLKPTSGRVSVFGLHPVVDEVEIKSRLAYVPDVVGFYPWMTVRDVLKYCAAFRSHWNQDLEGSLLSEFRLTPGQKANHLSKGQRTQLALITAVCPEPDLLVLDEPTSGLDPIIRREFIRTVIGAYQDAAPGERTIFVSTHLISEFEGLIDQFTIIDQGREVMTLGADEARQRFQKIFVRFDEGKSVGDLGGARVLSRHGRELELLIDGASTPALDRLRAQAPQAMSAEPLTLEEIFVATLSPERAAAV